MRRIVTRRIALATSAAGSLALALTLLFLLAPRDRIGGLPTAALLAIVALFLLPGATWLAWRLDRRAAHHAWQRAHDDDAPPSRPHRD
jgi:hypothetical protein